MGIFLALTEFSGRGIEACMYEKYACICLVQAVHFATIMQCIFLSAAAINICFRNSPSACSCAFLAARLCRSYEVECAHGMSALMLALRQLMACSTGSHRYHLLGRSHVDWVFSL